MPGLADLLGIPNPLAPYGGAITDDARRGELGVLRSPYGKSTELSVTVTDPRLNHGAATNIPTLVKGQTGLGALLMGARPTQQQYEVALLRAIERMLGGGFLPSYPSINAAVNKAENRPVSEKMQPYTREIR